MKIPQNLSEFYFAYVLSEKSRTDVLRSFAPEFSKVVAHHVTIEFKLRQSSVDDFVKLADSNPKVNVVGVARGDGVECVAVSINGDRKRSDGSFYHLTLSVEPPHKPVESNKLEDKIDVINGIFTLEGSFQFVKK